jgi:hypothetical protein
MGSGMTCSAAQLHEQMTPALASKLGGDVVVVVVGGPGAYPSGQPHDAGLGLHSWLVAHRHAARKRGERTCAAPASVQVGKRVLLFPELSVRFSQSQWTSSWVG